jgi:SAM-dependent methyltransferase
MPASLPDRHEYDTFFFNYIEEGAARSARCIAPLVVGALGIRTILDVGCGAGAWLREYERLGVAILGIDGDYVERERLLIAAQQFRALDVTSPFDLGERFDLVQCLEVAEHLPPPCSATLIANLTRHSDWVLFSAAVPGQGGEHHVNEQSCGFWRSLFEEHGFAAHDFLRPHLVGADVEPWYAYNTLLYAREAVGDRLPEVVRRTRVPEDSPIRDFTPLPFRLRKWVLRRLPVPLVSRLAVLKHRFMIRGADRS